jgi:predicted metal-dependent peptidase
MNSYYDFDDPVIKALYSARTALLYRKPLLGEVAVSMDIIVFNEEQQWVKTAATDGEKIYFCRPFVISLFHDANSSDPEIKLNGQKRLMAIIAHEIWHRLFGHVLRRGNRDPLYWGMAIDYVVNACIEEDKLGILPSSALLDAKFTSEHTAYEIYDYLVENKVEPQSTLEAHIEPVMAPGDAEGLEGAAARDAMTSQEVLDTIGGDISAKDGQFAMPKPSGKQVSDLTNHSRMQANQVINEGQAGNVPIGLVREIREIFSPQMDWRRWISTTLRSIVTDDYSFETLDDMTWATWYDYRNRRLGGENIPKNFCVILPGQVAQADTVEATVAIDASGSMTNRMIGELLSEMIGVLNCFNEARLRILVFDAEVHVDEVFTQDDLRKFKDFTFKRVKGGGGTSFTSVFDYLKEQRIKPHQLIFLTDGEPNGSWGNPNYCNTLFVIHDKAKKRARVAPFGSTTYYPE